MDTNCNRFFLLGRKHPLLIDETNLIYYKHGKVCSLDLSTHHSQLICHLSMPLYKKLFSYVRITERTLRLEPRCVASVGKGGFIFSYSGSIHYVDLEKKQCRTEHRYRDGMSNALQFVPIHDVPGFDDAIVYGEYWKNAKREPVRVFARKNGTWEAVYTFPKNTIKHIHGFVPDPYRQCVYILTGDKEEESGIWVAKNNFKEVEPLLVGKREYRACIGLADEQGLVFATDNPFATNHLRFASLSDAGNVSDVKDIMETNGPCIYGTDWNGKLVLSTSIEQDYSKHRNKVSAVFSRKLGGGTKSYETVVYVGNKQTGFFELVRYKKDFWPMGLCAFGTVQFPQEMNPDVLCLYPVSVKKYDGRAVMFKEQ